MKLIAVIAFWTFALARGQLAKTKNGLVKGKVRHSYDNKTFVSFEGIPYAQPPVGTLRFEEARAAEPWNGTLEADRLYTCVQYIPVPAAYFQGNEDCLYVNVYVPGEDINTNSRRDVVVHIHGGAFLLGSPRMMAGPHYVMNRDVIYVTFNYRLGIFGFLSSGDEVVPGNNGLKDQVLALKWIRDNIADFGGNPESVTITGLSAGASSVHYHYLSPKSKGLFHGGIAMSGSALNPWALVENPSHKFSKLVSIFKCEAKSTVEMVDCLRSKPIADMGLAIKEFYVFGDILPIPFGPVVEIEGPHSFLDEHPYTLLEEKRLASDVPLIMSCVKDEGIYPVGVFTLFDLLKEVDANWTTVAPSILEYEETVEPERQLNVSKRIRKFYFGDEKIQTSNVMKLVKLFSDRFFFIDIQKAAKLHARASKSDVYFYFYSYQSTQIVFFPAVKGTAHTDDSKMIFELLTSPMHLSPGDHKMMEFFADLIANFAKNRKPSINWKPLDESEVMNHLHIYSGSEWHMENTTSFAPVQFWKSLEIKENELHAIRSGAEIRAVFLPLLALCVMILSF